jgi:hypothetical protein
MPSERDAESDADARASLSGVTLLAAIGQGAAEGVSLGEDHRDAGRSAEQEEMSASAGGEPRAGGAQWGGRKKKQASVGGCCGARPAAACSS